MVPDRDSTSALTSLDGEDRATHKLIHDTRRTFLAHGVDGWFVEKAGGRTRLRLPASRIHLRENIAGS